LFNSIEVPRPDDLEGLPVDVALGDEPGVCSVTTWADDGDDVTVTWDQLAGSVQVRWRSRDVDRLTLTREAASKVSVRYEGGQVEFHVWLRSDGLSGELVVIAGALVTVADTLLRA
jgi:hypothetical protein